MRGNQAVIESHWSVFPAMICATPVEHLTFDDVLDTNMPRKVGRQSFFDWANFEGSILILFPEECPPPCDSRPREPTSLARSSKGAH
jgi:hypothetical protein